MNCDGCCRVLLLLMVLAARAEAAGSADKTRGYALLVGCTRYEHLAASYQLQGPANDVLMLRDLLVGRFGFPQKAVTILAEGSTAESRPTRENIRRELQRLTALAGPGDQVVIFLAGHGSQQPGPDPDNPSDPKALRMHRIFLPADTGKWDRAKKTVTNAITDDDFHQWLDGIRKSGVYLWVIVDACHSGGMIRGAGDEVARRVPSESLLPDDVIKEVRSQRPTGVRRTRSKPEEEPPGDLAWENEAMVVVYAAQASEVTVEKMLPADSPDGKRRGLFSYTLCQTLAQASRSLTYNELVHRVQSQYADAGRVFPTPLVQGKDRDREVLAAARWPGRSQILLDKDLDGLKINAGALHGLPKGTILAVYPPPGQARGERPLGYVRIVDRQTLESHVDPCAFGGLKTDPERLPLGGVCEPTAVDYGDLRLRVTVDRLDNRGQRIPEGQHQSLMGILGDLSRAQGSLVKLVDEPRQADWLVRWDRGDVFLIPAAGASACADCDLPPLYGPALKRESLAPWLGRRLTQIARVQNLKRLASSANEAFRDDAAIRIGLEVRLRSGQDDRQGQPVKAGPQGWTFRNGDRLLLRLTNPNNFPVDVTLLYIDSGFGIEALFPGPSNINRLFPGETVPVRIRVDSKTAGRENLVAVVVRGTDGLPADFTALAQPTLEAARGAERTRGALATPLGQLLQGAMFAAPGERSASLDDYRLELFSWTVVAGTAER